MRNARANVLSSSQSTGGNIPALTDLRPLEVREWMRASRGWADRNVVLKDYEMVWWNWWSALQPSSRFEPSPSRSSLQVNSASRSILPPTYLMDWESIRKPGKNGLILVIMSLRWWGVASTASGQWQKAVDDVSSAIFCMANEIEHAKEPTSGKRKRVTKVVKGGTAGKNTTGEGKSAKKSMPKGWVVIEDGPVQPAPLSQAGRGRLRSSGAAESSKRKADTVESPRPTTRVKRTRATCEYPHSAFLSQLLTSARWLEHTTIYSDQSAHHSSYNTSYLIPAS